MSFPVTPETQLRSRPCPREGSPSPDHPASRRRARLEQSKRIRRLWMELIHAARGKTNAYARPARRGGSDAHGVDLCRASPRQGRGMVQRDDRRKLMREEGDAPYDGLRRGTERRPAFRGCSKWRNAALYRARALDGRPATRASHLSLGVLLYRRVRASACAGADGPRSTRASRG